ncbi:MAG: hypothetical protein M5R36_05020 [Deltaproteobacteria bacterium]|nr:hypothetical protein [Deltaproteobacteria bacterium]
MKQLLTMTSDDIEKRCVTLTGGGCQPGFDNHFGYGRPNLRRAMEALGDGVDHAIPPDVRITSPRWWTVLDPADASDAEIEASINARGAAFEYEVQVARGHEPLDGEFSTVASGTGQAPVDGPVASIDLHELFTAQEMRTAGKDPHGHTFIVRVRAWPQGTPAVVGEDRKALAAYSDRGKDTGMMPGLPFDVMASGESSPALYDLDGRDGGRLEIIFGTTDGKVEVFGWDEELDEWARRPGFPVDLRDADRPTDIALAPPAVGDLFGTGRPSIVMATGNGALYAVHPEGNLHEVDGNPSPFVDGFPFVAPRPDPGTPKSFGHGATFAGAPVLYDLDGDGVLEIVAGNFQSQVYAVRVVDADEDGEADVVPGFPVTALSVAGVVPPGLVCRDDNGDPVEGIQILGTPAVGLLDPHSPDPALSQHPSIIVPTTEVC